MFFYISGFLQGIAVDNGDYGITSNAICPGFALTDRTYHL